MTGQRLMVYDRTCVGARLGLSHAWAIGARGYRLAGKLHAARGVSSWAEALRFLASHVPAEPIREIQFWGHGKWGLARIDREPLNRDSLRSNSPHARWLEAIRERLTPDALWWFRTCETFGAYAGHDFAQAFTAHQGCRAASHTFVIHALQSGLHSLEPGTRPAWPATEGLAQGSAARPVRALTSSPVAPHTISCFQTEVPPSW